MRGPIGGRRLSLTQPTRERSHSASPFHRRPDPSRRKHTDPATVTAVSKPSKPSKPSNLSETPKLPPIALQVPSTPKLTSPSVSADSLVAASSVSDPRLVTAELPKPRRRAFYRHRRITKSRAAKFVAIPLADTVFHTPAWSLRQLRDHAGFAPVTRSWQALLVALRDSVREVPTVIRLAWEMLKWTGCGVVAYVMLLRLLLFAVLIFPAVVRLAHWFITSPHILRTLRYGPHQRNMLDVYFPRSHPDMPGAGAGTGAGASGRRLPVLVNFMGGAWIIGYNRWSVGIGLRLGFEAGAIVICPDYRNFPQGTLTDMLTDCKHALDWVFANVADFGGDPHNITVCGQSAGAHLLSLVLLQKAMAEVHERNLLKKSAELEKSLSPDDRPVDEPPPGPADGWRVRDIKAVVGVSGLYDLVDIVPHLHKRGLYSSILKGIMGKDLFFASPTRAVVSHLCSRQAIVRLPPWFLFHGTADKTVPESSSENFAQALRSAGAKHVSLQYLVGMSHSEPIVEGPIRGDDPLAAALIPIVFSPQPWEPGSASLPVLPPREPLLPSGVVRLASVIMPF